MPAELPDKDGDNVCGNTFAGPKHAGWPFTTAGKTGVCQYIITPTFPAVCALIKLGALRCVSLEMCERGLKGKNAPRKPAVKVGLGSLSALRAFSPNLEPIFVQVYASELLHSNNPL